MNRTPIDWCDYSWNPVVGCWGPGGSEESPNWCPYCYARRFADWIIIGAQTGLGAKPPKPEWVKAIINQARAADIPVYLKDNLGWPEPIQEFPEDGRA